MRRKKNYGMRKCATPKRVTLPNGRTFVARQERVPRSELPAHIRMNRTYRGRVAPGRQRRRQQRGRDLISAFKKIAKHPITKQLIRTGAEHLPDLYVKGTSIIKNPRFKKILKLEVATKIINKLHEKGMEQ